MNPVMLLLVIVVDGIILSDAMVVGEASKLDVKVVSKLDVTSVDNNVSLVKTLVIIVGTISVVEIIRLDERLGIVVGVSEVNKIVVRLVMLVDEAVVSVGDTVVSISVVVVNSLVIALEMVGIVTILDIEVSKVNVVVGDGEINSLPVVDGVVGNTVNDVI